MIVFHKAQEEIARDRHRFRVVCAGRRFGKTLLSTFEIIGKASAKEGNDVAYIAPTYQQARDLAWDALKAHGAPGIVKVNESRLELNFKALGGGSSRVVLRGWESIETLRGMKFSFVVLDEVAMMKNFWMNWQEVIRPTLTDMRGDGLFISTPKGFNHFYDLYKLEETDDDFKSFRFTTYDNPFIPVDEVDKARTEITEDRFVQEYLADFRKTEGLVYKEFDRKKHIVYEVPHNVVQISAGVDFGFTNPTCILKILKDSDGRFTIADEWYKRGKTHQEVIEYARTVGASEFFPDPAEPGRIEEMRRAGLNCQEVNKDVKLGIDAIHNLFKKDKLFIHSSCVNLINEFETYSYRSGRGIDESEEPIKENDHGVDSARYCLLMKAPKTPSLETHAPAAPFAPPSY